MLHPLLRPWLLPLLAAHTLVATAADDTHAERAAKNFSQASSAASASAAHSIAASGQVTFAASAVPLTLGGAVLGSAATGSKAMANDSMRAATAPIGTPLEITDEAITVMPPDVALKTRNTTSKPESTKQ